jgi:2-hydroxy-3-keto-5-methylthiopentenyl-1-phosphate phosphatase
MESAESIFKEAHEYFEEIAEGKYNEMEIDPETRRMCKGMQSFIGAVRTMSKGMEESFQEILEKLEAIEDRLRKL